MAELPDVKLSVLRNGLGLAAPNATGIQAKIGTSSLGDANAPAAFTDGEALKTAFGTGPGVEAALVALQQCAQVVFCKAPSSTPGAAGVVTLTGTGDGTVAVAGAALDAYDAKIKITKATKTLAGGGLFQVSLDGGRTYGPEFAIPAAGTFAIENTGLTLTFAVPGQAGDKGFILDDVYAFTCTAPSSTLVEVQAAIDALKTSELDFEFVHIVGAPAAAGEAAMLTALDTKAQALFTAHKYEGAFFVMEAPAGNTDDQQKAAFTTNSDYVAVCAGGEYLTSPLDGRQVLRNVAWGATARAGAISLGTDAARVKDGPIAGVTGISRNEGKTPGLDSVGFTTMRTYERRRGYFLTNARLFSSPTSDFRYWQHRRIMNAACATAYDVLLEELHSDVLVDKDTGTIDEAAARAIEAKAERAERDRLGNEVSDVTVTLDRSGNILSTEEIGAVVDIVPKGYLKHIKARLGFKNPALAVSAA